MENACLVIVIPYFQRQPGVLQRALASVARQAGCPLPVRVLVVDDASPVPPEPELAAIAWPEGVRVEILRRPNGGPGAARNTGLDAAGADTLCVAFLDSDDAWSADSLQPQDDPRILDQRARRARVSCHQAPSLLHECALRIAKDAAQVSKSAETAGLGKHTQHIN